MKLALIPRTRANSDWEAAQATIALAGIRPLVQDTLEVTNGDEDVYTITHAQAKRVIIFNDSGNNGDIRIDLNATATATSLPVASGVYFVLEVEKGDVVHLFNTTGAPITVNICEIA